MIRWFGARETKCGGDTRASGIYLVVQDNVEVLEARIEIDSEGNNENSNLNVVQVKVAREQLQPAGQQIKRNRIRSSTLLSATCISNDERRREVMTALPILNIASCSALFHQRGNALSKGVDHGKHLLT